MSAAKKPSKSPKTTARHSLRAAIGSAIDEQDKMPTEHEALAVGLALVAAKWDGDSDFDKGMRLLQKRITQNDQAEPRG